MYTSSLHMCTEFIAVKWHVSYDISIVYVNDEDLSAISGLSNRNVEFAKLLSAERGASGKQTLEAVWMIHWRQWIRKQFPIYFLWFSYLREEEMRILQNETYITCISMYKREWRMENVCQSKISISV